MLSYRIVCLNKDNRDEWDKYCFSCANAWYWHTAEFQDFIIAANIFGKVINRSFIVYDNSSVISIVPLLICEIERFKGVMEKEIVYFGWATPYPAISTDLPEKETERLTEFIFNNVYDIAKTEKVSRAVFSVLYQQEQIYKRCMKRNIMLDKPDFLDISEYAQIVDLSGNINDIENTFRERYMRYVRAHKEKFDIEVITNKNISQIYCDECQAVCNKDSSQNWPEEKLPYLYKTVITGNGIFIRCSLRENKQAVGYLFVILYKNHSFDFAVAVNDEYKNFRVSQIMKVAAVRYLKSKNIKTYDLGIATMWSSIHRISSAKQRAITYFKRGFATDIKPMFITEKYFDREYFREIYKRRMELLEKDLFQEPNNCHEKI